MVADKAAPQKQLDDAESLVDNLQKQLEAQTLAIRTSNNALERQCAATSAQTALLEEELRRCHVVSPVGGTVLEKYAEMGDYAVVGRPLFKVADVSTMTLRAYLTSAQLQKVSVGQKVEVFADFGGGERNSYEGTVTWISSRSEFTPKTILTDDERAALVYAVKIAVRNDGAIKIGMYGEVRL